MTLRDIETIVLGLIGDKYSELSTDANRTADFALLHDCVNLAREEVKLNTSIPSLTMVGATIPSVAGQVRYSLPTDFDIPVKMFYQSASGGITELTQLYAANIATATLSTDTGTPESYIIAGTAGNLIQIYLVLIPEVGGESLLPVYKPVLTELTAPTNEDVLLRKYPMTVINFATAFAFQILKKDVEGYNKFYTLGLADCQKIDLREHQADANFKELPPSSIINARVGRLSK